jgi:ribosomal protein L37AE/L43A
MARSFLLLYFTLTLPDFPNPPNLKCPTRGVHSRNISDLTRRHDTLSGERVRAEQQLGKINVNLENLGKEATQIEREFKRVSTSPDELTSAISSSQARIDELRMQIADLERQIDAIRQEVIKQAVLVATTLARTYTMAEVYGRQFETVVCDEASMAPIPAVFWACSLATKSVTVAGDFRQLAPIAESKDARVKEWLRRDVFAAAGVNKDWETNTTAESPMVMLKTQYRMQSQIRAIISNVFYGNQLSDGNTISEKTRIRDSQPCPGVYAGLYDTSAIDPWCSWTSGHSRFNLYHAVLAVRLCQTAVTNFCNIGIITPYKAQTRLIKVLVEMNPALRDKVVVSNVHRFQGNERDLIIFDLVDSTGLPLGKLLRGRIDPEDIDNSEGARLINVACSRAKDKLAIIANLSYLKAKLSNDWSVSQVLDQIYQLGTFPAEQLVPGYADPSVTQARAVMQPVNIADTPISSLWTEEKFHSGVYKDLEGAKEYAIIMSPFITRERLKTYADLFRAKVKNKVQLQVVTRPPDQQGTVEKTEIENMLNHLQKVGISVVQRRSMHQKVVVIDGRIVWFGSLNPLSHRNTQELMFRLESEDFTKQVMDECALQAPGDDSKVVPPAVDISKISPRSCSNCGNRMKVIPKGRFGPFYKCDRDGSTANIKKEDLDQAILPEAKICPECGRAMELRRSKTGVFLGCSGFKDESNQCKYTRSL